MEEYVSKITKVMFKNVIIELRKDKNRKKIMKDIIEPVLEDINNKYYPHFITLITLLIILIILIILMMVYIYTTRPSNITAITKNINN